MFERNLDFHEINRFVQAGSGGQESRQSCSSGGGDDLTVLSAGRVAVDHRVCDVESDTAHIFFTECSLQRFMITKVINVFQSSSYLNFAELVSVESTASIEFVQYIFTNFHFPNCQT